MIFSSHGEKRPRDFATSRHDYFAGKNFRPCELYHDPYTEQSEGKQLNCRSPRFIALAIIRTPGPHHRDEVRTRAKKIFNVLKSIADRGIEDIRDARLAA